MECLRKEIARMIKEPRLDIIGIKGAGALEFRKRKIAIKAKVNK